jgi:hypothetical protein
LPVLSNRLFYSVSGYALGGGAELALMFVPNPNSSIDTFSYFRL